MNSRRTTMLLSAAWLLASSPHGFAGNEAQPTPDAQAAGPRPSSTHHADKTRPKHAATHKAGAKALPADAAQTDAAAENAASLERRRKAFFANKPDEAEKAGDLSSAPVGVTLGGSGGLTPEMGLKF